MSMAYRVDIQILRGIAVFLVVLYHINSSLAPGGFLGVDIFFVISGFLMHALYYKNDGASPALNFYLRRFKRIVPAYLVTVIISTFVGAFVFVPYEFGELRRIAISSIFLSPNIYFWTGESYFDEFSFRPLLHLWSLGVELQFYLLVPVFVLLIKKSRPAILVVTIFAFILCYFVQHISSKTAFFLLPFRLWEFLIGFCISAWFSNYGNLKRVSVFRQIVAALIVGAIFIVGFNRVSFNEHPGFHALLITLCTGAILSFGLPNFLTDSKFGRIFQLLGKYSYSLYLVHFPVLYYSYHNAFGGDAVNIAYDGKLLIVLALMGALTVLLFRFVESAAIKLNFRGIAIASFIAFSLLLSAHLANYYRFDEYTRLVSNAPLDRAYWRCGRWAKLVSIVQREKTYCLINDEVDKPSKKILLVGDSHADAIKMSLSAVASKYNAQLYFNLESCNVGKGSCGVKELSKLVSDLSIDTVVVNDLYYNLKADSLNRFAEELKGKGIKLLYVDPVPVYKFSVPRYLYQAHVGIAAGVAFIQDRKYYENLYAGTYAKLNNISLVRLPTLNYLCIDKCLINKGGVSYYSDSHHLSLSGAKLLEPMFEQYIFK